MTASTMALKARAFIKNRIASKIDLGIKRFAFGGPDEEPVDVVYLWVDGDDPDYKRKKERYIANERERNDALENKSVWENRWRNNDEILLSLRSLAAFWPWVNRIWIITDAQVPPIDGLEAKFREKISIVDHREICAGYEDRLPLYNSLSIETMMWRIDGLAERFVYFNDDMMTVRPLAKADFFIGSIPVLRGSYALEREYEKTTLHLECMRRAAMMIGGRSGLFLKTAHVPYALVKSELGRLFEAYKDAFESNIRYRVRDRRQFNPVSLFNHDRLARKRCAVDTGKDYVFLSESMCAKESPESLARKLARVRSGKMKFLCVNNLGLVRGKVPDFDGYLPAPVRAAE